MLLLSLTVTLVRDFRNSFVSGRVLEALDEMVCDLLLQLGASVFEARFCLGHSRRCSPGGNCCDLCSDTLYSLYVAKGSVCPIFLVHTTWKHSGS
jgi:hypothetical protein